MKVKVLAVSLLLLALIVAPVSAKTFWFVKPWDDPGGVVKYFKMGLTPVKSPYQGSDYWEWLDPDKPAAASYFDLYIPEAEYQDVKLTFSYGIDSPGWAGVKVFAFRVKPEIWPTYIPNPEKFSNQDYKVIYWGAPSTPVFSKTVTVTIPKGYTWVRVLCYDNDWKHHGKIRLWKVGYYTTGIVPSPPMTSPKVSVEISSVAGYIGLATGLTLLAYALTRKA